METKEWPQQRIRSLATQHFFKRTLLWTNFFYLNWKVRTCFGKNTRNTISKYIKHQSTGFFGVLHEEHLPHVEGLGPGSAWRVGLGGHVLAPGRRGMRRVSHDVSLGAAGAHRTLRRGHGPSQDRPLEHGHIATLGVRDNVTCVPVDKIEQGELTKIDMVWPCEERVPTNSLVTKASCCELQEICTLRQLVKQMEQLQANLINGTLSRPRKDQRLGWCQTSHPNHCNNRTLWIVSFPFCCIKCNSDRHCVCPRVGAGFVHLPWGFPGAKEGSGLPLLRWFTGVLSETVKLCDTGESMPPVTHRSLIAMARKGFRFQALCRFWEADVFFDGQGMFADETGTIPLPAAAKLTKLDLRKQLKETLIDHCYSVIQCCWTPRW